MVSRLELALALLGDGSVVQAPVSIQGQSNFAVSEKSNGEIEISFMEQEQPSQWENPQGSYPQEYYPQQDLYQEPKRNDTYKAPADNAGEMYQTSAANPHPNTYSPYNETPVPQPQAEPRIQVGSLVLDDRRDYGYENQAGYRRDHRNPVGEVVSVNPSNNGIIYGVVFDHGQEPYYYMEYEISPYTEQRGRRR